MTPFEKIDDACWKALRLGFEFSESFSIAAKDGIYVPIDNEEPICHVLEAVLLGEKTTAVAYLETDGFEIGDPTNDLMSILGVEQKWLESFCKAYRGETCATDDAYEAAKKIFAKYPPKTE